MKLAIVIPAYNEERTVCEVLLAFHGAAPDATLVVVDNASTDRTRALAEQLLAERRITGTVLTEPGLWKANAVRAGLRQVEADAYVLVDADATYSAGDLPALLEPIVAGVADLTIGDRLSGGGYDAQNTRPLHGAGNRLVTWLVNRLSGARLHDVMSGYRAVSRELVDHYPILSEGFELETEMTLHALENRFRVVEVPISYRARPRGSRSKLSTWRDGVRVLRTIVEIFGRHRPRRLARGTSGSLTSPPGREGDEGSRITPATGRR